MFVSVDTLDDIITLKVYLHQLVDDLGVNRDLRKADEDAPCDFSQLLTCVPRMLADLLYTVPDFGVCLQNVFNHISG